MLQNHHVWSLLTSCTIPCIAHSRSPICPCKSGQTQPHTPQRWWESRERIDVTVTQSLCNSVASFTFTGLDEGWWAESQNHGFPCFPQNFPLKSLKKSPFLLFPSPIHPQCSQGATTWQCKVTQGRTKPIPQWCTAQSHFGLCMLVIPPPPFTLNLRP